MGKTAARRLDNNARNYLILDGLLFKIIDDGEDKLDTVLCIPTSKVHILLDAYHSSILGGHTGITKCYHTINQRFYCPNLVETCEHTSQDVIYAKCSGKVRMLKDHIKRG